MAQSTTAYEAGATDFISKPLNWLILAHRIRYMLRAAARLRRSPSDAVPPHRREGSGRGGQPRQVGISRQYEPRASHAAQRDHRLLIDHARRHVRPDRRALRGIRQDHQRQRLASCFRSSTTFSTSPRPRSQGLELCRGRGRYRRGCRLFAPAIVDEMARSGSVTCSCRDRERFAAGFWGDGKKLRQILINLLSNAVKFTPAGGASA